MASSRCSIGRVTFGLAITLCAVGCQQVRPADHLARTAAARGVWREGEKRSATGLAVEALRFAEWLRNESCEDWLMQAYLISAESILYNIGNAETTGFKRCRLPLQDLIGASYDGPFATNLVAGGLFEPWQQSTRPRVFSPGKLKMTGERLDLAIEGEGFFEVETHDGRRAFTRCGEFKTITDGRIVTADGWVVTGLQPIESGTTSITVTPTGEFKCVGQYGTRIFQLVLCRFSNPEALKPVGPNIFEATTESGVPGIFMPGEDGCGKIRQGFLESANVQVEDELLDFMEIQRVCRAYVRKARRVSL